VDRSWVNRASLLGGVFVWTELVWTLCPIAMHVDWGFVPGLLKAD